MLGIVGKQTRIRGAISNGFIVLECFFSFLPDVHLPKACRKQHKYHIWYLLNEINIWIKMYKITVLLSLADRSR